MIKLSKSWDKIRNLKIATYAVLMGYKIALSASSTSGTTNNYILKTTLCAISIAQINEIEAIFTNILLLAEEKCYSTHMQVILVDKNRFDIN